MSKLSLDGRGTLEELEFAAACLARGASVSFPFGGKAPYDLIVDSGDSLWRLQVKKAALRTAGRWVANSSRRIGPRSNLQVAFYTHRDIDGLVTRAGGHWYFFMSVENLPTSVGVYPARSTCRYDKLKNNWAALNLPKLPLQLL